MLLHVQFAAQESIRIAIGQMALRAILARLADIFWPLARTLLPTMMSVTVCFVIVAQNLRIRLHVVAFAKEQRTRIGMIFLVPSASHALLDDTFWTLRE
jgi:uncharacterized RDD family membrane protein YckC